MTLAEAIKDIERQVSMFTHVYLDHTTIRMLDAATAGNNEWSGIHIGKYHFMKNQQGTWVHQIQLKHAEEILVAAREALVRQATVKLVGELT